MIGRLNGILIEKSINGEVLLDVHGVGYELLVPLTSFYDLPECTNEVILYTHFIVREDAQLLYGFVSKQERALFRLLIKANGVGPKLALTILSKMTTIEFINCVERDDVVSLIKLPGVGKKTAERLLVEMRDKLKLLLETGVGDERDFARQSSNITIKANTNEQDAIAALLALGYKPAQASRAVASIFNETMTSEELIKAALKNIG